jgi:predicted DNA-binding protein with PD1-like motif
VSWTVHSSTASRHLLLRADAGERLPGALAERLDAESVACGWLRGSGVLSEVALQAYDAHRGAPGPVRHIEGRVQVLSLEGCIALANGSPSFTLRALLSRETDHGLETIAGELVSARAVALEVLVTALDDVAVGRALDPSAGVWLVTGDGSASAAARAPIAAPAPSPAWSSAVEASDRGTAEPLRPAPAPSSPSLLGAVGAAAVIPQRVPRPTVDLDTPSPEAGDVVDHFAFGRAEVVKSDGDRLHLKVPGGGRVREIALEVLKVQRLEDTPEGKRHFRLERKL